MIKVKWKFILKLNGAMQNFREIKALIAHRRSSILLADKVIVMNNGEIVGQGNNNELLGNNEFYDRLFKEQYKSIK